MSQGPARTLLHIAFPPQGRSFKLRECFVFGNACAPALTNPALTVLLIVLVVSCQ